ncbi:MAG: aminoglycoside phosphotransferase family protein [Flavobacteriaceae bacterium]|nr:aminoglycoside phosphotransferase family protein [Flavobacteriaceae bacterium]
MENLDRVLENFEIPTGDFEFKTLSNGLINDTFMVSSNGKARYILQRVNTHVFKNVEALVNNIDLVLPVLKGEGYKKIILSSTKDGGTVFRTGAGDVWRLMTFIEDSHVFNTTGNPEVAKEAGRIIGLFHHLLADFDTTLLKETLANFHDLNFRFWQFGEALKKARPENVEMAKKAIDFVKKNIGGLLEINFSALPVRVCHNDTKLNNILFSRDNRALCLIDLDTLMPGTFLYDFGDAVRTIVNSAPEDERNLELIHFDEKMFRSFIEGIALNKNLLQKTEIEQLPSGVVLMPFLHGIRALTDYLENNRYYKVSYELQNLDRCFSLFRFAELALNKQDFMKACIKEVLTERAIE